MKRFNPYLGSFLEVMNAPCAMAHVWRQLDDQERMTICYVLLWTSTSMNNRRLGCGDCFCNEADAAFCRTNVRSLVAATSPRAMESNDLFAIRYDLMHSSRRSLILNGHGCGNKRKDTPNPTHWHVTTFTLEVTKQQQLSPSEIYVA